MAKSFIDNQCGACSTPLTDRQRLYCSRACRNTGLAMAKRVTKTCVICGRAFAVAPASAHRYSACSSECMARRKTAVNKQRQIASLRPESQAKRAATFLARRIAASCGCGCGAELLIAPNKMRSQRNGRVFLNREHYETWFRGENVTHLWQGGNFPTYYGPNWSIQRKRALRRDIVCKGCDAADGLIVHHRRPFRAYADYREANRLENLTTLCRACHARHHLTGTGGAAAPP